MATEAAIEAATTDVPARPSTRVSWATWSIAFFCDSYSELFSIVVPLWAIMLGFSPLEIGILVGSRHILSVFLAIHGGALTDRFGTRRVLIVLAALSTLNPLLFPAIPWFPFMLALQTLGGLAGSLSWVSAQALALQVSKADTTFISRFAFSARIGSTLAPATIGFLWDHGGPWVSFAATSAWGAVYLVAAMMIPDRAILQAGHGQARAPFTWTSLLPRLSDYIGAFSLLAVPAVVFVIAVSTVRIASSNIQSSFYVVYLKEISMPGSLIGTLLTISSVCAGVGTLLAGPIERVMAGKWMYLGATALSVAAIMSTPLLGTWFPVLAAVMVLRGFFQGVSAPVMFTYMSRSVAPSEQGLSIGLRSTANRVSSLTMPILMGATADIIGVGPSFFVIGAIFLMILGTVAVWARGRGDMT